MHTAQNLCLQARSQGFQLENRSGTELRFSDRQHQQAQVPGTTVSRVKTYRNLEIAVLRKADRTKSAGNSSCSNSATARMLVTSPSQPNGLRNTIVSLRSGPVEMISTGTPTTSSIFLI